MADELSGLDMGQLWSSPASLASQAATRLLDASVSGIRLLAPDNVSLDARSTLPVVAVVSGSYEMLWKLSFDQRGLITAMDVDANSLAVAYAVDQGFVVPSGQGMPALPEGSTANSVLMDLRERLGIGWAPSRLVLRAIVRDVVSNAAEVTLGPSQAAYVDPEVVKYRAEQRRLSRRTPIPPWPVADGVAVAYQPQPTSPAIPAAAGIALAAPRVQPITPELRCLVQGSFRLPADNASYLRPAPPAAPAGYASEAEAVLPITLLVVGSVDKAPRLWRLMVPSWQAAQDDQFTGHFMLDLCRLADFAAAEQTWFIYAFSGAVMGGALPMALVR